MNTIRGLKTPCVLIIDTDSLYTDNRSKFSVTNLHLKYQWLGSLFAFRWLARNWLRIVVLLIARNGERLVAVTEVAVYF